VTAKAVAGALGGATLPLTGTIVVKGPTDTYSSNGAAVPISAAAQVCTGSPTHTTYWVLQLTAAGQTLEVPVFVDAVAPGTPESGPPAGTAWGSVEIKVCLPSPDVPPPAGAAFGAKLFDAVLAIKGVFSGGSSEYRWRLIVVPYTAGSATPNAAGATESQGLMRRFGFVAAFVHYGAGLTAQVRGTVTEAGVAVVGVKVTIKGGTKAVTVTTNDTGDFKATVKIKKARAPITVTAVVPERDLGASACSATAAFGGLPCVDTSIGGFTMTVKARRVAK
jgi:hypothetical protein